MGEDLVAGCAGSGSETAWMRQVHGGDVIGATTGGLVGEGDALGRAVARALVDLAAKGS